MKIIVITSPEFIPGEAFLINTLMEGGVTRLHIRKPQATADEVRQLTQAIDSRWHSRLSLHDHHELAMEYGCGIHLNARNPQLPEGWHGTTSASCHTLEEVEERKRMCDYVFLSPIFNSKVIALGGITPRHLDYLKGIGFGGGAFLGHVWNNVEGESFRCDLDTIFDGYLKPEH